MHLDLFVEVSRSPEVFTIDQQTLVSKSNGEDVPNMLLAIRLSSFYVNSSHLRNGSLLIVYIECQFSQNVPSRSQSKLH